MTPELDALWASGHEVGVYAHMLFPEDEAILTRRIGTLWTYAELWRVASKNEYPKILELTAGLFADRYVKGTIPPDPERGYAVYAVLASLRLAGRGNEAVALRFGRIVEANLEPGELALVDLALGDDPRKSYGNDGPTVAELTGATRNPGAQHFQTLVLAAPAGRDRELEADKAFGGSASRRLPN